MPSADATRPRAGTARRGRTQVEPEGVGVRRCHDVLSAFRRRPLSSPPRPQIGGPTQRQRKSVDNAPEPNPPEAPMCRKSNPSLSKHDSTFRIDHVVFETNGNRRALGCVDERRFHPSDLGVILLQELRRREASCAVILDIVQLMPEHCHLVPAPSGGWTLSTAIGPAKARTAKRARSAVVDLGGGCARTGRGRFGGRLFADRTSSRIGRLGSLCASWVLSLGGSLWWAGLGRTAARVKIPSLAGTTHSTVA